MPEGEEEQQEIENLFEKIMKQNSPNSVKEIDMQVQEAQLIPNKLDPKRATLRHIIIKMSKNKDKKRILKAARERQRVTYKVIPIRLSAALASVAQWIEFWPVNQKVISSIPSQGTGLGCQPGPQ